MKLSKDEKAFIISLIRKDIDKTKRLLEKCWTFDRETLDSLTFFLLRRYQHEKGYGNPMVEKLMKSSLLSQK